MHEIRHTDTIDAIDTGGNSVQLLKYTEFLYGEEGLSYIETWDGRKVNVIDEATFQIVLTGEILKSAKRF